MRKLKLLLVIISVGLVLTTKAQSFPAGVHDPSSIIKDGDTYWIFATGDGIQAQYSKDLVTWENGPTPFTTTSFPSWIKNYAKTDDESFGGHFWAPDIIHMNNKYYLYYSCSMWGTMHSCIGCVTNKTLNPDSPDYKWEDLGDIGLHSPDFSANGSGWDVNMIDPAMMRSDDGKVWMIYGSFNKGGIMVSEVDTISGKPIGSKVSIANSWTGNRYFEGEGGCMFQRNGYYYLVYNKGGCCNGIASTYHMVIGRSTSPKGPFRDKDNRPLRVIGSASGGSPFFSHDDSRGNDDRFYGPGHFGIFQEDGTDYVTFHYYSPNGYYPSEEAGNKGGPTLGMGYLVWGNDEWPSLSFDFIDDGTYTLMNSNSGKVLDIQNHTATTNKYLWQYNPDQQYPTQKWTLTAVGNGEYTIKNYANDQLYIEASGTDNDELLKVTDDYKGTVNQKFRIAKRADKKVLIYPSASDKLVEIPYAYTTDSQVKLWTNTNHACQVWTLTNTEEETSITENLNLNVSIFPNPTSGAVRIIKTSEPSSLKIYDMHGKHLSTIPLKNTEQVIDMSSYQDGTYIFSIHSKTKNTQHIVIKQ